MKNWKNWILSAACFFLLAVIGNPVKAEEHVEQKTGLQRESAQALFENPEGMTVDLIYYHVSEDGSEKIAGKAGRVIIPAGITSVTVELQQKLLPRGLRLLEPKDIPLEEGTMEVRIQVYTPAATGDPEQKPADPTEKPTNPTEKPTNPAEKPADPTEKPADPTEKPIDPTEKPTDPTEKPTEKPTDPTEKPNKPAQKPDKPSKKPDPSNPKTGESSRIGLWMSLSIGSAGLLAFLLKKHIHMDPM